MFEGGELIRYVELDTALQGQLFFFFSNQWAVLLYFC